MCESLSMMIKLHRCSIPEIQHFFPLSLQVPLPKALESVETSLI